MGSSKVQPDEAIGDGKITNEHALQKKRGGLLGGTGSNQMVRKLRSLAVINAIRERETNPVMIPNFQGLSHQPFFVPASWPMNVIFLRKIYSILLQTEDPDADAHGNAVSTPLFCRTMVRVYKIFNGQDRDSIDFAKYDKGEKGFVTWHECCECWDQEKFAVKLTIAERIYFTFDQVGSSSSRLAGLVASFVMILIAVSSLSFVLSSLPNLKAPPKDCPTCEPQPHAIFSVMEFVAGIAFSIEFFVRLFTCSEVRFKYLDDEVVATTLTANIPIKYMSRFQRVWFFMSQPSNIIDLMAILPFYLEPVMPVNANLMVLRLIRLTRVFRVLKMGNLNSAKEILTECVTLSKPSLGMVLFIVAMQVLISSCLVYYTEIGSWDSETQTYVRPCSPANGKELCGPSPFSSIPATFWWTIETVTTVGYGDFSPTTGLGRLVGAITIIGGVIAFALPVGIIASNFDVAQARWEARGSGLNEQQLQDDEAVVAILMDAFGVDGRTEIRFDVYDYDGALEYPDFLGYCCLDVRSLAFEQAKSDAVIFTLPLREDRLMAARKCQGSITVSMEWMPEDYSGPNPALRHMKTMELGQVHVADSLVRLKVERIPHLCGKLTIKIINSKGLLNLDSRSQSDPFVVVSMYDQHTSPPNFVRWESDVVMDDCNPVFNQTTVFDVNWIPSDKPYELAGGAPFSYDVTPPDDKSKRLSKESIDTILDFPAKKILELQEQMVKMGAKFNFNDEFNGVKY